MIYLHENGVTVVATDEAKRGKVYELNGEKYYVARGVSDIKRIVDSGQYPLNRVITSKLTTLNYLFQIRAGYGQAAVPKKFNDDITNWDTSNVTEMKEVFTGWPEFNQDISNWDTSKVESMHGMFKSSKYVGNYYMGPTSFNQDISNWNTINVVDMSEMFLGATSFNQDISNWDVSNVKNMDYMFSGASSFNQPLGNWDVSNVKTMFGMFSDVTSIGIVAFVGTYEYNRAGSTSFNQPIGNWDVSNVETMTYMFSGATSFNQDISNWDVSNVKDMQGMFSGGRIAGLRPVSWNVPNPLENTKNPTSFNQPIGNWNVSNVESMEDMFDGATSFNQDISNWNMSNVKDTFGMFSGATSFNQDISNWNMSNIQDTSSMFNGATSFNQPIGNWNVSNVNTMSSMFRGATSFNQDLNGWNMSKVSGVVGMFHGATSFNSPIGKWKLNAVTDMEDMFREATAFNQDISSWDVSNVTQMKGMFQDATSFNQDLRNWKLNEKLPKSRTMFTGATAFKIKEHSPFLNIEPKIKKVDTSTANLSPEDKKAYSKIKKLIVSRDTDKIDLGIELAVSLNNSSIFSSLLAGCKLTQSEGRYEDSDKETKLVANKLFTGSGPATPYLKYALLSMIANVPDNDEIEIDESIKIKNITELNLNSISFKHGWQHSCKTPDISNLIYLKKLITSSTIPTQSSISSITELKLTDFFGSIEFLSAYTQLEHLTLSMSSYSSDSIESVESFKKLVSLRELILSPGGKLTDINFLSECKKLQKLHLRITERYSYDRGERIEDISVLSNLKNLEELNISGIHPDLDISPIGNCKKLKNLDIDFDDSDVVLRDLSILNSCKELSYLNISGRAPYRFNSTIENINGIKLPKNLISIGIQGKGYNSSDNSLTITGIDGGSLSNATRKIKPKSPNKGDILRVAEEELTDVDVTDNLVVSHYRGEPFTGIMYCNFGQGKHFYRSKEFDHVVETEFEMVKGLKHGSHKHFYTGGKLAGKLRIEHDFIDDEHDKIIGFYDGAGNNYVIKNPIEPSHALELLVKDKPVFVNEYGNQRYIHKLDNPTGLEGALFFYNDNVFSGQVLVHKHVSHWKPFDDLTHSLYGMIYEYIGDDNPRGGTPGDGSISFLINIKEGRLTGEFCASSGSKFFSGTIDDEGTMSPLYSVKVKDLSNDKSNELSLEGKSIVVTGVFEGYSRNELKALIKENGGTPSSSVTSNTFLIVAGAKMGPKKKVLADELGIKIIDIDSFVEEYINKSDDENIDTETSFIDIFYPELAEKKTISKKKLKSEDKKTFTKIKSLLKARDFDKIDMGIELLRSINIVEFYEALLVDCKIKTEADSQSVISNKYFTGSGPAQPYLDYALYLLIYYCPDEAEVHDSLRKKNINKLHTSTFFGSGYSSTNYSFPPIENFTSLYELKINFRSFNMDQSKLKDVLKNSSVEKIGIYEHQNSLMWLKNFPQLKKLKLQVDTYGSPTKDLHAFEYLTNLEELSMSCTSENLDFLNKCVNIKKLTINLGLGSEKSQSQGNIDALKYLTKLEKLSIAGLPDSDGNFSYAGLSYCKKLKNLEIGADSSTNVLANLKSCSELEELNLLSNGEFNIKLNTSNFYGIKKFDKLKKVDLDNATFKF